MQNGLSSVCVCNVRARQCDQKTLLNSSPIPPGMLTCLEYIISNSNHTLPLPYPVSLHPLGTIHRDRAWREPPPPPPPPMCAFALVCWCCVFAAVCAGCVLHLSIVNLNEWVDDLSADHFSLPTTVNLSTLSNGLLRPTARQKFRARGCGDNSISIHRDPVAVVNGLWSGVPAATVPRLRFLHVIHDVAVERLRVILWVEIHAHARKHF